MKAWLLLLGLTVAVAADPLDEAMQKYSALPEGRITFQLKPAQGDWQQSSTLVFRRPDRMHYWSETQFARQAPLQVHCWLDQSKLWSWTSKAEGANAPGHFYSSDDWPGGLKEAPTSGSLGPANFVMILLSGQRKFLELNPAKATDPDIWTSDDDQLVLDPVTRMVKQIVAWKAGKEMARAQLEYVDQSVTDEELTWQMPADSTLMKDP